jgi:16S rRNA (cytosine1402-N4)-methyltransferase
MDRDRDAVERARGRLPTGRITLIQENFCHLDRLEQKQFDGILLDLGMSSDQLDDGSRGFSFRLDGPLDMRMDQSQGPTAAEFLETAPRPQLIQAIRDFGEEVHWKRVVDTIEGVRGTGRLQRTLAFADLVRRVLPPNFRLKIDPATRVFQGVRMAVNGELAALETALPKALAALRPRGVLAVLTFHSLEDRRVKQAFREWSGLAIDCHDGRYADERVACGRLLADKPLLPGGDEVEKNPRSRSAKLRLFQKFGREEHRTQ